MIDGVEWAPIDTQSREKQEKAFSEEEILKAVQDMGNLKSPSPDGMTGEFKSFWNILKLDLVEVFQEFFKDGIINKRTNETYICLIPMKKKASKVKNFKPILLVTSLYKLIAKVLLAKRLKEVLP